MGKQMSLNAAEERYNDAKARLVEIRDQIESDIKIVKTNSGFIKASAGLIEEQSLRLYEFEVARDNTTVAVKSAVQMNEALRRIETNLAERDEHRTTVLEYEERAGISREGPI